MASSQPDQTDLASPNSQRELSPYEYTTSTPSPHFGVVFSPQHSHDLLTDRDNMSGTNFIAVDPSIEQSGQDAEVQPTKRRRAYMACLLCRERKTKCVLQPEETCCQQCKESRSDCTFPTRGPKRRRTEHEAEEMDRRIEALELLISKNVGQGTKDVSMTENHIETLPDTHCAQKMAERQDFEIITPSSSDSQGRAKSVQEMESPWATNMIFPPDLGGNGVGTSMLDRLLSKTGRLSADSGQLRYFGPSTSLYMFDLGFPAPISTTPSPAEREARNMIEELSGETHADILDHFWTFYNSIVEVVPQEAFLEGHSADHDELYSAFLHLTMLAIGLRFVDKETPEVMKLMVSPYESIFHRQAKTMIEGELDKRGKLSSIQALLLLGDLECGAGRDMTGWMYSGMACRLFFDLGLNLNGVSLGLNSREAEVRQKVSIACVMMDRCCSLFYVRPTCVKKGDLDAFYVGKSNPWLHTFESTTGQTIIYEAAMSLMDVASKVGDSIATRTSEVDESSYMTMQILHGQLERWYKNLNHSIVWNSRNISTAPRGFFLLHQQYHAIRIMLHRPFANHKPVPDADGPIPANRNTNSTLHSSNICLKSGLQLAKIFKAASSRFNLRQSFTTATQHAGTGVRALVEVLVHESHPSRRRETVHHLLFLKSVLCELGYVYKHAIMMHRVLEIVLDETGWGAESTFQRPSEKEQDLPFSTATPPYVATGARDSVSSATGPTDTDGSVIGSHFEMDLARSQAIWDFSSHNVTDGLTTLPLQDGISDAWLSKHYLV